MSPKGDWGLYIRQPDPLEGSYVRFFGAWEYPKNSIPPSENRKIVGLIDEKLNIYIIGVMRGNEVLQ